MDMHQSPDAPVTVELGDDYPELREAVRRLSENYPGAYWRDLDDRSGFLGALIPEEYGGTGLPLRPPP